MIRPASRPATPPAASPDPVAPSLVGRPLRRLAALLYAFIAALYLLTGSGRLGNLDAGSMFAVTQSMFVDRRIDADPCTAQTNGNQCVPGVDGRNYSGYGLVSSVVAYPSFSVGWYAGKALHKDRPMLAGTAVSLANALIAAFVPVLLFLWAVRLGFRPLHAVLAALTLAFATPTWFHSVKGFHSEPHFTLAFLGACYFLSLPRLRGSAWWAGLSLGLAAGSRVYGLILTPILLYYLWRTSVREGDDRRLLLNRLIGFGIGLGVCLLLIGVMNTVRFGSPLKSGYHLAFPTLGALLSTPLFFGLQSVLFSGRVGLIWFTPVLLLLIFAARRFWRTHPDEAVMCFGVGIVSLLFFGKYTAWDGGWSYGPRLLTPTLPFWTLPMAALFADLWPGRAVNTSGTRAPHWLRPLTVGLIGLSLLVQVPGLFTSMSRYYYLTKYYEKAGTRPWWHGSALLQAVDALPQLFTPPTAVATPGEQTPAVGDDGEPTDVQGMSPQEYLTRIPNGINQVTPDLWLLKATYLGLPAAVPVAAGLVLLGAAGLALGQLRHHLRVLDPPMTVGDTAPAGAV